MRWVAPFLLLVALPLCAADILLWPDTPAKVVSKLYAHHVDEGARHHWIADQLTTYLLLQDGDQEVAVTLGRCNAASIEHYACAFSRQGDDWTALGIVPIHLDDMMDLHLTDSDLHHLGLPAPYWAPAREAHNWHVYPEPMGFVR